MDPSCAYASGKNLYSSYVLWRGGGIKRTRLSADCRHQWTAGFLSGVAVSEVSGGWSSGTRTRTSCGCSRCTLPDVGWSGRVEFIGLVHDNVAKVNLLLYWFSASAVVCTSRYILIYLYCCLPLKQPTNLDTLALWLAVVPACQTIEPAVYSTTTSGLG